MMRQRWVLFLLGGGLLVWLWVALLSDTAVANNPLSPNAPVGTGFTYQGQLKQSGSVVTANCDMAFRVFDQASGGMQAGSPITQTVAVNAGLFTTSLDWGSAVFTGEARWLDIRVRCPAGSGAFTPLTPRQNISPAPYALHALNADYANRVVVAESGGDFTSIQAALDSITDNSFNKRYLVWVAPGIYFEQVTMKPYVDIEGAGVGVTYISHLSAVPTEDTGAVIGANDAELRHLSVAGGSSALGAFGVAMYNNNVSPSLKDVSLTVVLLSGTNGYALLNRNGASPLLEDVTAVVAGTGNIQIGIYNDDNSSPMMKRVTAEVYLGADNRGVYNRNNSNPTMIEVTAITDQATNANSNRAIYNNGSSPLMQQVTAVARDASTLNTAVYNDAGSAPTLIDVQAMASDGATAVGIRASNGSIVTIQGGNITASNATTLYGLYGFGNSVLKIQGGQITVNDGVNAIGVFASSSPLTMTHTVVNVINNSGSNRGLQVQATSVLLQDVAITAQSTADNRAVQVQDASLTMHNSVIKAMNGNLNLGVYSTAGGGSYTVMIHGSQITAASPIIGDVEFTTLIGATYLNGGAVLPNGGTVTCAAVYDEAFVFYASLCP